MHNSGLKNWMVHRAARFELAWPDGVADAAGIDAAALALVAAAGNLRSLGRSARSYIARALKVSVRELELLDAERIDWIPDERVVDLDELSINGARRASQSTPVAASCPKSRGVPILGRILEAGRVENFEDWTPDDGPRLPVRYAGSPDAFSLQLSAAFPPFGTSTCLVFQVIPSGHLMDNQLALLTYGNSDVVTELCNIRRQGHKVLRSPSNCVTADLVNIPVEEIHRAARLLGFHAVQ